MIYSPSIVVSNGIINYQRLLEVEDPFAFLASLKTGDLQISDDFDPANLNKKLHKANGAVDLDALHRELDIAKLVRSVLDDNSHMPRDLRIDDGDLPLAKNILDWVTDTKFAGTVTTPYVPQLVWGVLLFAEWCPRCSDADYLIHSHSAGDSLTTFSSKVQMLDYGVCPACKARKSELVKSGELNFYQELAVQAGQRSGKTATAGGILCPYMTHRVLKMQKPCDVYGISSSTVLHGTFCALTYQQAKDTLWEFYYGTLCESKWFADYHQMLRFYEAKYGQPLLKFNDTFVRYIPRNLMWYPAGPDKRVLRGRTRIMGGIDEIAYFDNDATSNKVKTSAHHVYDALDRSLLTIRGAAERLLFSGYDNILTACNINVSSPVSQRDKVCSLVRQAQGSRTMLGIHAPTWKINPNFPRDCSTIQEAYRKNPNEAEKDYGANPPLVANPYVSNERQIEEAFSGKKNVIKLMDVVKNRKNTALATKWAEIRKIKSTRKPSLLTLDAGLTNNSFAITCTRIDEETGFFVADLLCEVIPEPGIPLNYTKIYEEIISRTIEERNVKVMLADRWNSVKLLQDAQADFGITCAQYSLKYIDIGITKSHLEAGSLLLPARETEGDIKSLLSMDMEDYPACFKGRPVDHLAMQIMTVQDTGVQVIKGDGLTDDIWRALALGVYGLSTEKFSELLIGDAPPRENSTFLGVSRLGSGGGGSGMVSTGMASNGTMLGVMLRGR